jgi:hypothetical protein
MAILKNIILHTDGFLTLENPDKGTMLKKQLIIIARGRAQGYLLTLPPTSGTMSRRSVVPFAPQFFTTKGLEENESIAD